MRGRERDREREKEREIERGREKEREIVREKDSEGERERSERFGRPRGQSGNLVLIFNLAAIHRTITWTFAFKVAQQPIWHPEGSTHSGGLLNLARLQMWPYS